MAESSPDDPFAGLPNDNEYAKNIEELDLEDKKQQIKKVLINLALQAEEEMLS